MSFYYFLMSRLFFREREKKGKKLISVFDRQFETQSKKDRKISQKIRKLLRKDLNIEETPHLPLNNLINLRK